jgi:predicted O-methyltransferase YrrM
MSITQKLGRIFGAQQKPPEPAKPAKPGKAAKPDQTPASEFEALISGLTGGVTVPEALYLRDLIGACKYGARVEVGSYRGKSAVALCRGLPETAANGRPTLYCVEPHKPFKGFYGGEFGPKDRGEFYKVMLATEGFQRVALVNLSSEVVTPGWREPLGFIFIDGDHTYAGVKRDFDSWAPHLMAGALIAFDDSVDPKCGPFQLVEELLQTADFELVSRSGKITTLRKAFWRGAPPVRSPEAVLRILVPCEDMGLLGGLLRFERAGEELLRRGHQVTFCTLSDQLPEQWQGRVPVIRFADAWYRQWDVTMVPGAGFPGVPWETFAAFRDARFGLRMQHLLNDRSLKENFLALNRHFAPHVVAFNNDDWAPGTFTEFKGNSFHHLIGACDSTFFTPSIPRPQASHAAQAGQWIIGGQTRKNPEALLAALRLLPGKFALKLYGPPESLPAGHEDLVKAGRLHLAGPLWGRELAEFYHGIDSYLSPETHAGWCNAAAEAMASGVPLICTRPGTAAFAEDRVTALVLENPAPEAIAAAVRALEASPELAQSLAKAGRERIARFDWPAYCDQLLVLCRTGREHHYFRLPALGLHGKWPAEERLKGLEPILSAAAGKTVLDLGAAEGWIAVSMLRAGAKSVHGFELDASRVEAANKLCAEYPGSKFLQADLSDWDTAAARAKTEFLPAYDIVLYLGVHHHLPKASRMETLLGAAALATGLFAIRTSAALFAEDAIENALAERGWRVTASGEGDSGTLLGATRIFSKS